MPSDPRRRGRNSVAGLFLSGVMSAAALGFGPVAAADLENEDTDSATPRSSQQAHDARAAAQQARDRARERQDRLRQMHGRPADAATERAQADPDNRDDTPVEAPSGLLAVDGESVAPPPLLLTPTPPSEVRRVPLQAPSPADAPALAEDTLIVSPHGPSISTPVPHEPPPVASEPPPLGFWALPKGYFHVRDTEEVYSVGGPVLRDGRWYAVDNHGRIWAVDRDVAGRTPAELVGRVPSEEPGPPTPRGDALPAQPYGAPLDEIGRWFKNTFLG